VELYPTLRSAVIEKLLQSVDDIKVGFPREEENFCSRILKFERQI
jgi:hypothetical protein